MLTDLHLKYFFKITINQIIPEFFRRRLPYMDVYSKLFLSVLFFVFQRALILKRSLFKIKIICCVSFLL